MSRINSNTRMRLNGVLVDLPQVIVNFIVKLQVS